MKTLALVLLLPGLACADIYKCTDSSGKMLYSDRPCDPASVQEDVSLDERDWVKRLESNVPHGVQISSVRRSSTETTINFSLAAMEQSSQFLRLAAKISGQSAALIKIIAPHGGKLGSAEMKVSDQMPNVFRRRAEKKLP